ncbi:OB-fold nucleic acid binding domain-containing protein [Kribbia dieselivorans]|uniref:OB-fold nucleic acid binding domain-containing protein n=1 Tax=Kribbia dieselivorans TaxID=331526 RepID=UPI00083942C8|nr:OB-fold nucleic acid binding domain-containing protein [Kribbia dieselivorans]
MARTVFGRWGRDLTRSTSEVDASALAEDSARVGCQHLNECADRTHVSVAGVLNSVTLRPRKHVPLLVAELYDGTDTVRLVWLGRRAIRGIEPGVHVRASGLLTRLEGRPTIHNPAYEIMPARVR